MEGVPPPLELLERESEPCAQGLLSLTWEIQFSHSEGCQASVRGALLSGSLMQERHAVSLGWTSSLPTDVTGSAASLPIQLCYTCANASQRARDPEGRPRKLFSTDFFFFFKQCRFTEKFRHQYREFPHISYPVSPIISIDQPIYWYVFSNDSPLLFGCP